MPLRYPLLLILCFINSCSSVNLQVAATSATVCMDYNGSELVLSDVRLTRESGIKLAYQGYNNLEGPVWYEGALYYSNIGNRKDIATGDVVTNRTTIWRWVPGSEAEVWLDDSNAGTNGLALDQRGNLIAARHLDGSISQIGWQDKRIIPLTKTYNNKRFNSPNDLVVASDGTIYFTDPDWNVPSDIKQAIQGGESQHIYRITNTGQVSKTDITSLVVQLKNKPNGIMLSLDESELLVAGLNGLWKFAITDTGVSSPKKLLTTPIDGLGKDCAGNIYVTTTIQSETGTSNQVIRILNRHYEQVGDIAVPDIQIVTNVAFGGAQRNILYVTSLTVPDNDAGTGPRVCNGSPCKPAGIYSVELNIPGFPY